jgi:hypothetical protein
MKYSQTIGFILTLFLLFLTTQPLIIIESRHWVITGWKVAETNFGQPGKFMLYMGVMNLLLFALPYIAAKRFNMVFAILNFSWTIRNYLVLAACSMGECPEKQWSLYACIFVSFAILVMTFLPKIDVNKKGAN